MDSITDLLESGSIAENSSLSRAYPAMSSYSCPALQQALELCHIHDKNLIRGSFIRVTERKISEWSARNRLKLVYSQGELAAVAVLTVVTSRQPVKDFSGTARFCMQSGDLAIKRLACRPGREGALVEFLLNQKRGVSRLWLRIWQEHPIDRAVTHLLSAKWMGTKVLAGSELVGIWRLGDEVEMQELPASERWTMRRLDINVLSCRLAKIAALGKSDQLITHYSAHYNARSSWSALSLRSYGGRPDFIIKPSEMPKEWGKQNPEKLDWEIADTTARQDLVELEPLIQAIPGPKHRIRIMRLAAGGTIKRHSDAIDRDAGTTTGKLLRIHIPICTNPAVWFTSWDLGGRSTRVHMAQGEAWYLDTRKPHEVHNAGDTDRLHLVMDVASSPELLQLTGRQ